MTDDEDLDDLVDDGADTTAIEAKSDVATRDGAYTTHLAAVERERWIKLTARHTEQIRQLCAQVTKLGAVPAVMPPLIEVVVGNANDAAKIHHLQTELRVAQSQIDEHARQKAALRVQINQLVADVDKLRKDRS